MQALAERLDAELAGAVLEGVEPLGFSALKTVVPAPDSFIGATLERVGRHAKYLILDFGDVGRILIHLSQAGRLDVEEPPKRTRAEGLGGAAPLRRTARPTLVREYGHERKAAWWVLAPGDDGPLETPRPRARLRRVRRAASSTATTAGASTRCCATSARSSGVGRGYADDALWRAQLSPYASLRSLDDDERARLLDAIRDVHGRAASSANAARTGGLSQPKLGEHFEVHARVRHAVPALRRDAAARELRESRGRVLPACQTGGKVLADRRMSRLVK